jgi:hypothetical protein
MTMCDCNAEYIGPLTGRLVAHRGDVVRRTKGMTNRGGFGERAMNEVLIFKLSNAKSSMGVKSMRMDRRPHTTCALHRGEPLVCTHVSERSKLVSLAYELESLHIRVLVNTQRQRSTASITDLYTQPCALNLSNSLPWTVTLAFRDELA